MFAASKTAAPAAAANFIESVFSTYLYTGNGSTQTITNNIDLSTYGGLVWTKLRNALTGHALADTAQGVQKILQSNSTAAQQSYSGYITSFNSNGYSFGDASVYNDNLKTFVSWTFRKQPKFFDVVTFTTGDTHSGSAYTFNHNLGSTPGFVLVKATTTTGAWFCYHRSTGTTKYLLLNDTVAAGTLSNGNWAASSTTFTVPDEAFSAGTRTYVAYLFAHNAGGFGTSNADNVISCGSFTTDGSGNATVNLGYEPQWLLIKPTGTASSWFVSDNMRGMSNPQYVYTLSPNNSSAENTADYWYPTATGFSLANSSFYANAPCIYIAIRRGPMKVPTSGTSVYSVFADGATTNPKTFAAGFPTDFAISQVRSTGAGSYNYAGSRLTGNPQYLIPQTTGAEQTDATPIWTFDLQNSFKQNISAVSMVSWLFQRAPSFFDEVCYTGTGSATTVTHNLGVAPELIFLKVRNNADDWFVRSSAFPTIGSNGYGTLNGTPAIGNWGDSYNPTATTFAVGTNINQNGSGFTYVAYLFASCPGVSKVGSYSGTGATQTISCGFAARFVLIKRTDSTGSWWVWDTARGMVSGTDPRLALNSSAAETNANWVYTNASGFQIVTTDATVNASGGSYIFLAVG